MMSETPRRRKFLTMNKSQEPFLAVANGGTKCTGQGKGFCAIRDTLSGQGREE